MLTPDTQRQFRLPGVERPTVVASFTLLSVVEATSVTGPMKPLLMFSQRARTGSDAFPGIRHSLITTVRGKPGPERPVNSFLEAAASTGLEVDIAFEKWPLDPGVLGQMAAHIRHRRPDIVETHDFKSHFLMWILRKYRLPPFRWLAFHHGYTKMSTRVRLYQQLDRISLPRADAVVTLCRPFVTQLADRGVRQDRISVIANAVEPRSDPAKSELFALRQSLGLSAGDCVLLTVGRLSAEKGHMELLQAFRRLPVEVPGGRVRLLVVGEGQEGERLRSQAADLGDRVIFAGHRRDPWPFYHLADIFALPSHTEGSPLVLFEAMAAGLPIVASAVGGIPEVVEGGRSATLIPPRDVGALHHALQDLVNSPSSRLRYAEAAKKAVEGFSPEAYEHKLRSIYNKLLAT